MLGGIKNRYLKNIRIAVFYTDMFNCCKEFPVGTNTNV